MSDVVIPVDVQAALDAYLAARTNDPTWEGYVQSLGPGVALDVATDLCLWTARDERAAHWIAGHYERDPDDPSAELGVRPSSSSLDCFLEVEPGTIGYIALHRNGVPCDTQYWEVTLGEDDWESTGRVTATEWRQWVMQQADTDMIADYWAVAACRAACLSWCPEWARSQYQEAV